MQRALSFDHNPPLMAPMRFFLSVPLFAALAALLLFWQGDAALATRWGPSTLALTHLLTLGCLSAAIVGALIQMLPVVAGISLPNAGQLARVVHGLLCGGTLLLAAAFLGQWPLLFPPALLLLLAALLSFLGICTVALWQQHSSGAAATVAAIRLSLGALGVTVVLGALLACAFAWPGHLPLRVLQLTDLHAMWGLLGWVGLIVIGVAYQVIPMFQVTELYPKPLSRMLATALFLLLVVWSVATGFLHDEAGRPHAAPAWPVLAGYIGFAGVTLYLLARRKRPKADPTTLFWRMAMASLIGCGVLWLLPQDPLAKPLAIGLLFIVGFAYSTVNGMLYKIVPFLVWYHLQEVRIHGVTVPGVNQVIPQGRATAQFWLHALALLLLLGAAWWPDALARIAAIALAASALGLLLNLFTAIRLYRRLRPLPAGTTIC